MSARPGKVLDVAHSEDRLVLHENGRIQRDVDIVVDAETLDRMWKGYLCVNCFEPFENAWPTVCPICSFNVASDQIEALQPNTLPGEVKLGSRVKLADEFERLKELAEYERRTGIVVPGG